MSFYNSAALRGGSKLQDAIDELSGGWQLGELDEAGNYVNGALTAERENLNDIAFDIRTRYEVPDAVMTQGFQDAYNYDSAVAAGDADYLRRWRQNLPEARKRFAKYIRKKVHTWGSAPQRFDKDERDRRHAESVQRRQNAIAALGPIEWVGSDPYTGENMRTTGRFRYTYPGNGSPWTAEQRALPRSRRPAIPPPGWYQDLGIARIRRNRRGRRRPRAHPLDIPPRDRAPPAANIVNLDAAQNQI